MTAYSTSFFCPLIFILVVISADSMTAMPEIPFRKYLIADHSFEYFFEYQFDNLDYPVKAYRKREFRTNITAEDQSMLFPDLVGDTMREADSNYSLTSDDVHVFLTQTTYGRQFLNGCKIIVGVELGVLAMLTMMPRSFTRWEENYMQKGLQNLKRAYTEPPVWDQDHWFHNYVGHPYGGSVYYNTLRSQGAMPFQSFLFSAFISTTWEYVIEAIAERPSTQDLFITPVVGSVLGELIYQATKVMKKNGCSFPEKVLITVMNPMEVVFNGYR